MEQPRLTDGVLVLRPFDRADVDAVLPLEDAEMIRWFGFPHPSTRADLVGAIETWQRGWAAGSVVAYLVTSAATAAPQGFCDLKLLRDQVGQLSWATYEPYRRRGIATRALRLLCAYAFADLGLARVQAYVDPDNVASCRTALSAGLRVEGLCRSLETIGNQRRDLLLHSRLPTD